MLFTQISFMCDSAHSYFGTDKTSWQDELKPCFAWLQDQRLNGAVPAGGCP